MNVRFNTLCDYERNNANVQVTCRACDHVGVLDAKKLNRYFFCQRWNTALEVVGRHLYCSKCKGRPRTIRPTPKPPDRPKWMDDEYQWKKLVKRLRG